MEPEPPHPSPPRTFGRIVWLLAGFAFALRLFDLGWRELWVDEGITWRFAEMLSRFELGEQLRLEPTPPLYYGLIGLLLRLFGDSDVILRFPSALGGALAIPLVAFLGARMHLPRAGLAAALFLTLHPWHFFLSREARVYPILLTLTLALSLKLWDALAGNQKGTSPWRDWVMVGVLLLLCFYSHLFGLFVGVAVALLVLVLAPDRATRLRGLAAVGGAFLLLTPYLLIVAPTLSTSGANWSQELMYDALSEERSLARVYEGHLIGARYHLLQRELALPETPPLLRWPALGAQTVLLVYALVGLGRRQGPERRAVIFLGSLYLLPFLLPWASGILAGSIFFQPGRHDFLVLGSLALLLGAGFTALRRDFPKIALALLVPIALSASFRLAWLHLLPASEESSQRGEFLAAVAQPGDLAICFGLERLLAERYTRLAETTKANPAALEFASFPAETDDHPGWSDPRPLLRRLPELELEARNRVQQLQHDGKRRLITVERSLAARSGRIPGQQFDEIWLRELQNAGWRVEHSREDLQVRIWRLP